MLAHKLGQDHGRFCLANFVFSAQNISYLSYKKQNLLVDSVRSVFLVLSLASQQASIRRILGGN